MNNEKQIRVLALFGSSIFANRGTPIRVRSLLNSLSHNRGLVLYTASTDEVVSFSVRHVKVSRSLFSDFRKIRSLLKEEKIDLVIGHTMSTYKLLSLVSFLMRVPIVLEMHGFIEEEMKTDTLFAYVKYQVLKVVHSLFYRLPALITTCSETAAEKLSKYNKNIAVIYGGVDIKLFHPFSKPVSDHLIIGYAGNTRVWQGLPFLIDTFVSNKLYSEKFNLFLLLSEHHEFAKDIQGIEIAQAVPSTQVPDQLSRCDILVIPRVASEVNRLSFPSKLMEYLAMGLPVVASKTSDMHKIVTHEVNGLLYEPGNSEELVTCLLKLKDVNLREKLGRGGRALVETQYSWDHQADLFYMRLQRMLEK